MRPCNGEHGLGAGQATPGMDTPSKDSLRKDRGSCRRQTGANTMTPWPGSGPAMLAVLLFLASMSLATVTSAQDNSALPEEATPFTRSELYTYLAGNTQVWDPNGGAYYAEDGTLQTLWDGVRDDGTWSTTEAGELCWHVYEWGELPCEAYYRSAGVVIYVYQGDTGPAPELQEGNTLDYLQAGIEVPDSVENLDPNVALDLLTPEETSALVSDKTMILGPEGAVYHAPDFTLTTVWNGVHQTGRWSVDDKGGICWHVDAWGVEPCRYYFFRDGVLMSLYKELPRQADEFVEGDATGGP